MSCDPAAVRHRWLFGDYVVYARDMYLAREIYEYVLEHADLDEPFGVVETGTGTGNWLRVRRKGERKREL